MLNTRNFFVFLTSLYLTTGTPVRSADSVIVTDVPDEVIAAESGIFGQADLSAAGMQVEDESRLQNSIDLYRERIRNLQTTHGVYFDEIGEELVGLGLVYRNSGRYQEAIEAFNQSLQINRINQGLYNPNQLALLELIIETNTALSDWQSLEQNYEYLYWVNRRVYGENDPHLLPVIERLGRWHLNAYSLRSDAIPFRHLQTAEDLYNDAINIIEENYGGNDQRLVDALYGIVMSNYEMYVYANNTFNVDDMGYGTRSAGRMERMLEEMEARQELISDSYREGKKAMSRIVDIIGDNPKIPADARATALVHLGDWYLLFGQKSAAVDTYEMANQAFLDSGLAQAEINELLSQPRSLPAMKFPVDYDRKSNTSENGNYVLAQFTVTKSGQARDIKIIESSPADNERLARQAKRTILSTRFRPRFENGQPVTTQGVNLKYVFYE